MKETGATMMSATGVPVLASLISAAMPLEVTVTLTPVSLV